MLIERPEYMERLKSFKDQDLIKVVTGLRRSGKSTLFELFIRYLKTIGVEDDQIIKINFDDPMYNFETAKELYDYLLEWAPEGKKAYVFLDEVQMVPEFQKAVNGLRVRENFDVYITGSNAYLLSGELATLLSGRYIEIHMLPLSFKEYLVGLYPEVGDIEVLKRKVNLRAVFDDYMNYGGLPQTINYYAQNDGVMVPEATEIREYIENIFSTIVYKDIMMRRKVGDKDLLERIIKFILDNIGQPLSTKRITDVLNGNQRKVSYHTVENYIAALEECFLIYRADRYDVRGRELLSTGYKYFVVDSGLRSYLLGRGMGEDSGQLLENVVYLELTRRRNQVRVGKYDNLEVDFVADNRDSVAYYQVSKDVSGAETFEREVKPLQGIDDNYPKYLLTLDGGAGGDLKGVMHENVVEWLLG